MLAVQRVQSVQPAIIEHLLCVGMHTVPSLAPDAMQSHQLPLCPWLSHSSYTTFSSADKLGSVPASGPFHLPCPLLDVLFPNLSPTSPFLERASLLTLENLRPSLQPIALFYLPHSTYYDMNLRLFAYRFVVYVPHLLEFHRCDGGGQVSKVPGSHTMLGTQ